MALSSTNFCDTCGAANRDQARFCRVCGNSFNITGNISLNNTLTDLLPKVLLKQRYAILAQAGRGGFGAVYKAKDIQFSNRLVAIKEMSKSSIELQNIAEATASFNHEARLLADLTHPNLPRIYEQFAEGGRSYLVMDFIEGDTLEDHLEKLGNTKLPVEKTLDIALQLCSVVEYLHTRQPPIIFRDLKPGNIMMTPRRHVYLIDFGIARHFMPGQEKDTTALGSTGYAPPEQYGKSQTTTRADIYSLGATLHQLLTGDDPSERPFHFEPLRFTDPLLAGLDTLVMSMVSIAINDRPESISIVRQELQRIMAQYTQSLPAQQAWASTLPVPLPALSGSSISMKQSQIYLQPVLHQTPSKKPQRQTQIQIRPQPSTLYVCHGHTGRITAVGWSPDGKYLASASYDKTVLIWNATNGNHLLMYQGHAARVNSLAWSPDSKFVVSASDDQSAQVWEATTGKQIHTFNGHNGPVLTVAWSPDGKRIASAGEDKTVQVWDAITNKLIVKYEDHSDKVHCLAWSPDGHYLASGGKDCKLRIKELDKVREGHSFLRKLLFPRYGHKTFGGYQGPINGLAWSPDSKCIATVSSDHHIRVRDIYLNTEFMIGEESWTTMKNTIAWSPTNKQVVAIGGNDKAVCVWDTSTRKHFVYYGHSGYVMTVAWSPDGSRVASGSVDRTLQVWQTVQLSETK